MCKDCICNTCKHDDCTRMCADVCPTNEQIVTECSDYEPKENN